MSPACPIRLTMSQWPELAGGQMVKETYFTLQGEGAYAIYVVVCFCLTVYSLWYLHERDRTAMAGRFCDTDFRGTNRPGGVRFEGAMALATHIRKTWVDAEDGRPYVMFTGDEPLLQLDVDLIDACHALSFEVAIKTNGTLPIPFGVDWVCVSPKPQSELVVRYGNELKLVCPQAEFGLEDFDGLAFEHFFLQLMGSADWATKVLSAAYYQAHHRWQRSFQTHKLLGIP